MIYENHWNQVDYYCYTIALSCGCGRGVRRATLFKWSLRGTCPCGQSEVCDTVVMKPKIGVFYGNDEWQQITDEGVRAV